MMYLKQIKKKKNQCNQNSLGRLIIKSLELQHIRFLHINGFFLLPPCATIYLPLENKELFRAALLAVLSPYNRSMIHSISKYYLKVNTSHKCPDCALLLYDLFQGPFAATSTRIMLQSKPGITCHPEPASKLLHIQKNRSGQECQREQIY